jgi:hypothetical protein
MSRFPVIVTGRFAGICELVVHFTPNCNCPVPLLAVVLIEPGQPPPEFELTFKVPVLK